MQHACYALRAAKSFSPPLRRPSAPSAAPAANRRPGDYAGEGPGRGQAPPPRRRPPSVPLADRLPRPLSSADRPGQATRAEPTGAVRPAPACRRPSSAPSSIACRGRCPRRSGADKAARVEARRAVWPPLPVPLYIACPGRCPRRSGLGKAAGAEARCMRSGRPSPAAGLPQFPLPTASHGPFPAGPAGASHAGGAHGRGQARPCLPTAFLSPFVHRLPGPLSPAKRRRQGRTGGGPAGGLAAAQAGPAPPRACWVGGGGSGRRDRVPGQPVGSDRRVRPSGRRGGRPGACRSRGRCR